MNVVMQNPDQDEMSFLTQIRKELSVQTKGEAVRLIAPVLQALRQTLTIQQANNLLNRLPDFLKLVFVSNWKYQEEQVSITYLDEFVCLVMEREQKNNKSIFKNEVQALWLVILTLKKLYKLIDLENFEGLSKSMRKELRDLPAEAA